MRFRRSLFFIGMVAAAAVAAPGCRRHAASVQECRAVLDRLIELELGESGYRDPVVRRRWQQELGRRFAADLEPCRGRMVPNDLRSCLGAARTPEEIAHRCLE